MYIVNDPCNLELHYDLINSLTRAKRIIVVTGAGISVSGGIPDFRSQGGLFEQLKNRFHGTISRGQDLFDARWIDGIRLILDEQLDFNEEETSRDDESENEDVSNDVHFNHREKTVSSFKEFSQLKKNEVPLREGAKLFLSFMAELKQLVNQASPTATHKFLKYLADRKRLLRVYTQNIDCLEEKVGLKLSTYYNGIGSSSELTTLCTDILSSSQDTEMAQSQGICSDYYSSSSQISLGSDDVPNTISSSDKNQMEKCVVLLHGSLHYVVCTLCDYRKEFSGIIEETFRQGLAMFCPECEMLQSLREAAGLRRRSIGILRPDVVLYNELHPQGDWIASIFKTDLKRKPDLLLVIGTSLQIPGCKQLVKKVAKLVQMQKGKVIFINNAPPTSPKEWFDIFDAHFMGDCDQIVGKLMELIDAYPLGLSKKLKSCPDVNMSLNSQTKILKRRRSDSSIKMLKFEMWNMLSKFSCLLISSCCSCFSNHFMKHDCLRW
jgi:NAD-dependent histone deacetylase SIR2